MKIFIHELSDYGTELDFTQDEKWVSDAVVRVDEKLDADAFRPVAVKPRPVKVHFSMRKVDEVVVVSGNIDTYVQLVCSRCALYYPLTTRPKFSALFCKDPLMAGVAHQEAGRPVGQNQGHARHAHDDSEDDGSESGKDLDITYISEDFVDLAAVLTEQLQLQVPFQPLCRENCKGMCPQCGADLNVGRCACAKIATVRPFSVLSDFKVPN